MYPNGHVEHPNSNEFSLFMTQQKIKRTNFIETIVVKPKKEIMEAKGI